MWLHDGKMKFLQRDDENDDDNNDDGNDESSWWWQFTIAYNSETFCP